MHSPQVLPIEDGEDQRLWVPSMAAQSILTIEVGWPDRKVPISATDLEVTSGGHHKKRRWEDQHRLFYRDYMKKRGLLPNPIRLVPIRLEDVCHTYQAGIATFPNLEEGWAKLKKTRAELSAKDGKKQTKYHQSSVILF